jgi:hypothetical protein
MGRTNILVVFAALALLTLSFAIAEPSVVQVNASETDGPHGIGTALTITVFFNETVNLTGAPNLELALGTPRNATYNAGNNSAQLDFTFTVASSDEATDLDYTGTGALTLNGGTINGTATNESADLTLVAPGAAGSLGDARDIVIDGVLPTGSISAPTASQVLSNASPLIVFTIADNRVTTLAYRVFIDDVLNATASAPNGTLVNETLAGFADGTYTVNVEITDNASNAQNSSDVTFSIDTTPPTVTITAPANGTNTTDTSPTLTVTFADNIATNVSYTVTVNGVLNESGPANVGAGFLINLTDFSEASHTIVVNATDDAGNSGTDSITLVVDGTLPVPVFNASVNNTISGNGAVAFNFTITDNLDTNISYLLYIDSVATGISGDADAGVQTERVQLAVPSGAHTLVLEATDDAGNSANSTPVFVTVDQTVPSIAITNPANNSFQTSSSVAVTVNVTDDGTTTLNYTVAVDGTTNQTGSLLNNTLWVINLTGFTEASHTIAVFVEDIAGNVVNDAINLTVDSSAPTSTITAPATGTPRPHSP